MVNGTKSLGWLLAEPTPMPFFAAEAPAASGRCPRAAGWSRRFLGFDSTRGFARMRSDQNSMRAMVMVSLAGILTMCVQNIPVDDNPQPQLDGSFDHGKCEERAAPSISPNSPTQATHKSDIGPPRTGTVPSWWSSIEICPERGEA